MYAAFDPPGPVGDTTPESITTTGGQFGVTATLRSTPLVMPGIR